MTKATIIGAGMAGLLAACKFPGATIYEAGPERVEHRAVLRFRDESVSKLTGIPFKRVEVQKAVFDGPNKPLITGLCPLNIQNRYAIKVTGNLTSRSINNLDPSVRYIAPDDFHQRLIDRFRGQISFNTPVDAGDILSIRDLMPQTAIISTMPMKLMAGMMGLDLSGSEFRMEPEPILVTRYKLNFPVSDVYQTIYFPQQSMQVYRASITGPDLIIEGKAMGGDDTYYANGELKEILGAFGLSQSDVTFSEQKVQKFGKIVPLDKQVRESIIYELTKEFNVFSLGRFACWKSILLDDVAKDLDRLENMISANMYAKHLMFTKK